MTKRERREKANRLRELAKEHKKVLRDMIGQYEYSGTAYDHKVKDLRELQERFNREYMRE